MENLGWNLEYDDVIKGCEPIKTKNLYFQFELKEISVQYLSIDKDELFNRRQTICEWEYPFQKPINSLFINFAPDNDIDYHYYRDKYDIFTPSYIPLYENIYSYDEKYSYDSGDTISIKIYYNSTNNLFKIILEHLNSSQQSCLWENYGFRKLPTKIIKGHLFYKKVPYMTNENYEDLEKLIMIRPILDKYLPYDIIELIEQYFYKKECVISNYIIQEI